MAIVQQVHGQGVASLSLPSAIGAGHTLIAAVAERGGISWDYAAEGWTACPDGVETTGGADGIVTVYKHTVGGESQALSYLAPLTYLSGAFYEHDSLLYPDPAEHASVPGSGIVLSSGPIDAVAGFTVGIAAQGVGGGYDSVAAGVHYGLAAGWTEDHDNQTVGGGHPTVVVGHRFDAGTYDFEATNQLPSGDAWAAQIVSFAGPPPPITPGPIVDVYDPDDVFLATLPAKDVRIRPELNAVGSGAFKINRYADEATATVLAKDNYCRVTIPQIDPNPIFGFFLDEGDFTLVSSDEKGGEDLSFQGHGSLSYWARAMWLAESFLVPWWPAYLDDGDPGDPGPPDPTDVGALAFKAGTYKYLLNGDVNQTTRTASHAFRTMSTGGFTGYIDRRMKITMPNGVVTWLCRISSGVYANRWFRPYGTGVKFYPRRAVYAFGNSVLMESIDDGDKPGQVLRAMYDEAFAADRPIHPIPAMTVDFDSTTDSNGAAWATTDALRAVSASLGDDYLSTIAKLIATGVLDVECDVDLVQHAYNAPLGTDRHSTTFATGKVRFAKGVNIADQVVRELADTARGTFAEALGPNDGDVGRATLAGSPPREISVRGDSSDATALAALGLAELERRFLHSDSIAFNVGTPTIGHEDELAGLYLPGPAGSARGNYWPGDRVTLHTGTGEQDFNEATLRVAAITIWFDEANNLRHSVELSSIAGGLPDTSGSSGSGSSGLTAGGTGGGPTPPADLFQLREERDQPEGYPSLDSDGRVDYRELETSWKQSVRLAVSTPVTIGTALVAGGTLDGLVVAEGDDVLLLAQAAASGNGIYTIPDSGSAARRPDLSIGADFLGAAVLVREGTAAGRTYRSTATSAPVVGTDPIAFAVAGASALDDLTDVDATSPTDGDIVRWSAAAGRWVKTGLPNPVLEADGSLVFETDGSLIWEWP